MGKLKIFLVITLGCALCVVRCALSSAQEDALEFTLDVDSATVPIPNVLKPNIDLSGRGLHKEQGWPQSLAGQQALDAWEQDIGFNGMYRVQYNLWDIQELAKDKQEEDKLFSNYDAIFKKITAAGGTVILSIFGTPAGLGNVLDKRSAPADLKVFKSLVKGVIRNLSCEKKFNIWYEVWSAPDLDTFFLGREQEYLNVYRAVAEAAKELEQETKVRIRVGGPGISWWFQNFDGNSVVTPERSLVYEFIKFCSRYRLPLDFISWHAYSTDPKAEKELNRYNKKPLELVRDWLSYFNLNRNTPVIIDEWNFDSGMNMLQERDEKANICASYVLSRLKNMYQAGVDYQLYFCLEDFNNPKAGVVSNVGLFCFNPARPKERGIAKATYNAFRMLGKINGELFLSPQKLNDDFAGLLAARDGDTVVVLAYNYIDPGIANNFLSRNIGTLEGSERKALLNLIKSGKARALISSQEPLTKLRLAKKAKAMLKKAQELSAQADKFKKSGRNLKISIKNLKGGYLCDRYIISASCVLGCEFSPAVADQEISSEEYQETVALEPYSLQLLVFRKKPPQAEVIPEAAEAPAAEVVLNPAGAAQPAETAQEQGNFTNKTDE